MVLYVLKFSAELENVSSVKFSDPTYFKLDLKQSNSDEVRKGLLISTEHKVRMENVPESDENTVNFAVKFGGQGKQCTLDIVTDPNITGIRDFTENDEMKENYVSIAGFECRGLEPITWHIPTDGFEITSTNGTIFKDCDLSSEDGWYEYDETNECSVSVTNIKYKFEIVNIAKGKKGGKRAKKAKKK